LDQGAHSRTGEKGQGAGAFQQLFVDRELRMKELKKEIKRLKEKS
jgi:hypothetical protein